MTQDKAKIWKSADNFIKSTNFVCTAKLNLTMLNLLPQYYMVLSQNQNKLHTHNLCTQEDVK